MLLKIRNSSSDSLAMLSRFSPIFFIDLSHQFNIFFPAITSKPQRPSSLSGFRFPCSQDCYAPQLIVVHDAFRRSGLMPNTTDPEVPTADALFAALQKLLRFLSSSLDQTNACLFPRLPELVGMRVRVEVGARKLLKDYEFTEGRC